AKAECLQVTGSFKFRGGVNWLASLDAKTLKRGVVAYSSGNHAQGVAAAAARFGASATLVMPSDAPSFKQQATRAWGARVVTYDRVRESREAIGEAIAAETGATLIPPFDHALTIAGQGTCGLEIQEQATEAGIVIDQMIVCCSGGGLAAGLGLAFSEHPPKAGLWTAEPAGFDDMKRSLASGKPERNARAEGSICDALLAPQPGTIPFAINRVLYQDGYAVTDDEALAAMRVAFESFRVVVEPGGAVALAAALFQPRPNNADVVCVTLSGGNVDEAMFTRALKTAVPPFGP
ncbi:MAG: threonine ammonia-lyase, partial [Rhodospirillales bacterium]